MRASALIAATTLVVTRICSIRHNLPPPGTHHSQDQDHKQQCASCSSSTPEWPTREKLTDARKRIPPTRIAPTSVATVRKLHHSLRPPPPPAPTTSVPDIATFLGKIGRKCAQHAPKFQEWSQLFSATSAQLKALGVEPARTRRYILRWRETFRISASASAGGAGGANGKGGEVQLVEHKRGRKIDGGERRRKEIRAKRYAAERKAAAEAAGGGQS